MAIEVDFQMCDFASGICACNTYHHVAEKKSFHFLLVAIGASCLHMVRLKEAF